MKNMEKNSLSEKLKSYKKRVKFIDKMLEKNNKLYEKIENLDGFLGLLDRCISFISVMSGFAVVVIFLLISMSNVRNIIYGIISLILSSFLAYKLIVDDMCLVSSILNIILNITYPIDKLFKRHFEDKIKQISESLEELKNNNAIEESVNLNSENEIEDKEKNYENVEKNKEIDNKIAELNKLKSQLMDSISNSNLKKKK